MNNKPRIGVLGLTFDLYDKAYPDLKKRREIFLRNLLNLLADKIEFKFQGICSTGEEIKRNIDEFERAKCDAILVIYLTYAPSLIAVRALLDCKLPIIIWNTQEAVEINLNASPTIILENHGVHGVQDLTSVLKRIGRDFIVISGYWKDEKILEKLARTLRITKIISILKTTRIGLLGYPLQGMGDFNLDETILLSKLGPEVIHIHLEELVNLIREVPEAELQAIISKDYEIFSCDKNITKEEHEASAKFEWAIRKLINSYRLSGWSQNFMVLGKDKRIQTLPFLAASKLMDEGIGYGAEGDVGVVVSFLIMKEISGQATMTEMFSIDFNSQALLMSHMGELNIGMARKDRPIKIIRNNFQLLETSFYIPTPVFSLEP